MIRGDVQKRAQRREKRAAHIVASVETAKLHQQPNRAHLKLSQNQHTGRKLGIHSTSYAVLFFLLLFTGVLLIFINQQSVKAGPPITGSSDINLSGVVLGSPPANAPVILVPGDGTHFTQTIITISGTCDDGLLVEIYRNNAFAGSQMCSSSGNFSLNVTIIPGLNTLIAKMSDSLGQYGPDSTPVNVYLDPVPSSTPGSSGTGTSVVPSGLPFLIYTQPVQRGVLPHKAMTMKYEVDGGRAPYAISIKWGDNSADDIMALAENGNFEKTHNYEKPGQYVVSISGTDSLGNKAFTQTIVIVNGSPASGGGGFVFGPVDCGQDQSIICSIINSTDLLWPVFAVATTMTISFWMGEQIVLRKYKHILKNV